MQGFLIRFRQSVILFILLVTSLVLMTNHAKQGKAFQNLTSGLFELMATIETWISSLASGTIGIYTGYIQLVDAKQEQQRLRKKIGVFENKLSRLYEVEAENRRLMNLLSFQESVPFIMIPARVVGKDFNSWSRTIIVNEGSRSGIAAGMAVVRPEGVVGRIFSVSPNYALVQLTIDSNSAIPGVFQRTRAQGIVEGKITDLCRVKYLDRLADIKAGDLLVTSGLGGVYPKGLIIGTVSSIEKQPYGLFQDVAISPAVDFSRLEEVLVVKNSQLEEYDLQLERMQE